MIRLDLDGLAVHKNSPRWRTEKCLRPVPYKLDSEGLGLAVELPGPAYLAALLRLDGLDAFRRSSAIVVRPAGSHEEPTPLDMTAARDALLQVLRDLPNRTDAERPYRDLRLAASTRSPRVSGYALDVLRALRAELSTEPAAPTKPKAPRGPGLTETERKRGHRARKVAAERAASAWWLEGWLHDEDDAPTPGSRVLASALYAEAREVLEDLAEDEDTLDDEDETPIVVPRRRVFLEVASALLGPPTHTKQGTTYTVPKESRMTVAEALLDRAARMLLEESRADLKTLLGTAESTSAEVAPVRHLRAV